MFNLMNYIQTNKPELTNLMLNLLTGSKEIYTYLSTFGLNKHCFTENINNFDEEQIQADLVCNQIIINNLANCQDIFALASEELTELTHFNKNGKYIICIDPLDGSKNLEFNLSLGTFFTIFEVKNTKELKFSGKDIVAAGYFLYGPSIHLTISLGKGVEIFEIDNDSDSYLNIYSKIKIPENGNYYSINEGEMNSFNPNIINYLNNIKQKGGYKTRYIGTLIADLHRTILNGGIFLYPTTSKYKEGKLRLFFEVFPASYLITEAGGIAIDEFGNSILEKNSNDFFAKTSIIFGGLKNVKEYLAFFN